MAKLTDHELAGYLTEPKVLGALNGKAKGYNQEAARRLEQRAAAYQRIARGFKVFYQADMADIERTGHEHFNPITVAYAEMLRDDETSDAKMDYAAVNEVMAWVEGVPEAQAS